MILNATNINSLWLTREKVSFTGGIVKSALYKDTVQFVSLWH